MTPGTTTAAAVDIYTAVMAAMVRHAGMEHGCIANAGKLVGAVGGALSLLAANTSDPEAFIAAVAEVARDLKGPAALIAAAMREQAGVAAPQWPQGLA
jgi:hypothetical protein